MKVRDAIRMLEDGGWIPVVDERQAHRQFKHPSKPGRVTIAGHLSDELARGTLNSILKQAQLEQER